jgi:AbrB family looped-hinge helix DNA binding protein
MPAIDAGARILTLESKNSHYIERFAMRITSKGQVTIPVEIREKAGLLPGTEVDFALESEGVRIVKTAAPRRETRGQEVVRRLRGTATVKMSTDEIMALTRGED